MKLQIKNMVCRHCIEAVLEVFRQMELEVNSIKLGEVELKHKPENINWEKLKTLLVHDGFELLEDRELQVIEQIKTLIIKMIHHEQWPDGIKNSVVLSEQLGFKYAYLSKLFSKHEQLTIEKYIILQKITRVKELLSYQELTLSEIAFNLGYRSVQHLSNQFKSITGMSVSQYKHLRLNDRKALNEL